MKLRLSLFSALVPFLFAAPTAQAQTTRELTGTLVAAMNGTHTPAMGAIIFRDGRIAASAVTGLRRTDQSAHVALGDSWIIGSTGKPQTVAMVARLVERGIVSWDTPLAKMLPALADQMRPEYRSVTLVQLLSHHAGLPENVDDPAFVQSFFTDKRPLRAQRLAYVSRALRDDPVYAPGSDFGYSNTGFLLAAVVAEAATGKSYEALMRREIFRPLGMTSAGFGATPRDQPSGHDEDRKSVV